LAPVSPVSPVIVYVIEESGAAVTTLTSRQRSLSRCDHEERKTEKLDKREHCLAPVSPVSPVIAQTIEESATVNALE
jgi:hypothetical protein